jgi:hypothetical protein
MANDLPGLVSALARASGARPVATESVSRPGYGLQDHWVSEATRRALAKGGWDVVVLQQGPSATEGRPSLLEYSARFAAEARRLGARTALYMVWPSRARARDFDGVSDSYRMASEATGAILLPAGDAWRIAWAEDPDLALYGPDGFHPSPAGSYLAALVILQGLTGAPPTGLPRTVRLPSGGSIDLDEKAAALIQSAAAKVHPRISVPAGG